VTDAALASAILADAAAKALADAGNDAGCAASIGPTLPAVPAPIPTSQLLIWVASRGVLAAADAAATNANAIVASACIALKCVLTGGASSLDITNPTIAGTSTTPGLLDVLTTSGILLANADTTGTDPTPGSKADLIAFGSVAQVIDSGQVSRVWQTYRPGGLVVGNG
jgi:hypothetical protein